MNKFYSLFTLSIIGLRAENSLVSGAQGILLVPLPEGQGPSLSILMVLHMGATQITVWLPVLHKATNGKHIELSALDSHALSLLLF